MSRNNDHFFAEGAKARRREGAKARRREGAKARRREGAKARRREGAKARTFLLGRAFSCARGRILFAMPVLLAAAIAMTPKSAVGQLRPEMVINDIGCGENGLPDEVNLLLAAQVTDTVTVSLVVADPTVATVTPPTLTFVPADGVRAAKSITVHCLDDAIRNSSSRVTTLTATASGANYDGLTYTASITNVDDEPIRATLTEGRSLSYTIGVLPTEGGGDIVVAIESSNPIALAVTPETLTWTEMDSGLKQTVYVTLLDNNVPGDQTATITHTPPANYRFPIQDIIFTIIDDGDSLPGLLIDPASVAIYEGSDAGYTVALDAKPIAEVTVTITGHSGTDLTLDKTSLTFTTSDWNMPQTVTVTAGEDEDTENDAATLTHAASGGGYDAVTSDVGVTVNDDDAPITREVSLSVAPNPVDEGATATVTAQLSGALGADVTIPLELTAGTAEASDYGSLASIAIKGGETTGTGAIATAQDDDTEDEIFIVALAALPPELTAGDPFSVDVTILDDDKLPPTPSVSLSVAPNPVDEGASATVTAQLSGALADGVTIPLELTAGTAEASDYGALSELSIFIGGGKLAADVTFPTFEDADQDDETFTVALGSLPAEVTAGDPSSVEVTILDDDKLPPTPAVSLSVAPNPVDEGATATVTAQLSGALGADVTIPLTLTAGTAETGDYGALASIAIKGGETIGTGMIATAQDADQDDETFTVALGSLPAEVTAGDPSSVEVTILDDDKLPPTPAVSLSVAPNPVDEGATATVTAQLSGALGADVTIPLTLTAGTAETGDYGALASIAIKGGETIGTGMIATAQDADQDDETFTVALGSLPAEVTAGDPSSVEVTILDDDKLPPTPAVSLSVAPNPVDEGVTATVTAQLSGALGADVTIPLTLTAGTAETGDYGALASIAIKGGETIGTGVIATAQDADQDDETFTVALDNLPAEVTAGDPSSVEITILDDDKPPPPPPLSSVSLSVTPNPVDEGVTATVTAQLSGALGADVTIPLTLTAGTAETGDYGALASIAIKGGETIGTGMIATAQDADQDDETFTVALGSLPAEVTAGDPSSVEITILDDDKPPPNRPPTVTASCDPCVAARRGEVRLIATAADPDNDPITYGWSAARGSFSGADKALARWTAPAELGRIAIRVETSDGRGGSASASVEVEVVNRTPKFEQPSYGFELSEKLGGRESPVVLGRVAAEDPDGDPLTYELASGDRDLFAIEALDGTVRYVGPGENFEIEPNRFELVVRTLDGFGGEARAEIAVEVTDINEAPEAVDDRAETFEDKSVRIDLIANDVEPEGERLHVASMTAPAHGTVALASGGGVTYAPVADWHGVDSFAYVVSDASGLTAEATVEVTVLPVNDAPRAVGTLPDYALDEGGGAIEVDLSPFFVDTDGDALVHGARSSDPDVVAAAVAGTILTLTPRVYGSATVEAWAEDPGGLRATLSVRVGVSDRPQRAIIENMLASTARAHLASVRAALGRRIGADPCEASRLAVRGRSVPLGRDAAAQMIGQLGTGVRSAAYAALSMGGNSGAYGGGPLTQPGVSTPSGPETARQAENRLEAALRSTPARTLDLSGGSKGGAEFLLSWGGGRRDGERCSGRGRWSLWSQGDAQTFEGTPRTFGYEGGYDGVLSTGWLGLDAALGTRWLAGIAVSRSGGEGDWRVGASEGRLKQTMTAVHPYVRWTGGAASVWASVGVGAGDAENLRTSGRRGASATNLRIGLVEVKRRLGAPGGLDLGLLGDAAWAALRTGDGHETVDGQDAHANQIRIGADLTLPVRLGGADLTPFGAVHVRRDGGAGQTGTGLEVAGGLRAAFGVVSLDAQGRLLAVHTADGYGERGAALTLAVGTRASEGLSLSVSPRWGDPALGPGALERGPLGRMPWPGEPQPHRWTLNASGNYVASLPEGFRIELFGNYGAATGGPGVGLRIGMPGNSGGP